MSYQNNRRQSSIRIPTKGGTWPHTCSGARAFLGVIVDAGAEFVLGMPAATGDEPSLTSLPDALLASGLMPRVHHVIETAFAIAKGKPDRYEFGSSRIVAELLGRTDAGATWDRKAGSPAGCRPVVVFAGRDRWTRYRARVP